MHDQLCAPAAQAVAMELKGHKENTTPNIQIVKIMTSCVSPYELKAGPAVM